MGVNNIGSNEVFRKLTPKKVEARRERIDKQEIYKGQFKDGLPAGSGIQALAARTKLMSGDLSESEKSGKQEPPEQTNSPGAEPPKDPDNNPTSTKQAKQKARLAAREKEVMEEWRNAMSLGVQNAHLIGGSDKPLTTEQARILIKNGVKNFRNCHFKRGVKLNDLDLTDIQFRGINASEIDFSNSKLTDCVFTKALLDRSNFNNTTINNCRGDAVYFIESSFNNAKLIESDFESSNFIKSDFTGAELKYCDFSDTKMQLTKWHEASVRGANPINFYAANFSGVDFTQMSKEFLENANFIGSNCNHANFAGIELPISSFFDQNYDELETRATNANFKGTIFSKKATEKDKELNISFACLSGSNFEDADLTNVNKFSDCFFIGANLSKLKTQPYVELENCDFRLADLRGNKLSEWMFKCTQIFNCKLDADQKETVKSLIDEDLLSQERTFGIGSLTGTNLENADLSGAIIEDSLCFNNLKNVNFGSVKGDDQTLFIEGEVGGISIKFCDFRGSNIQDAIFQEGETIYSSGSIFDEGFDSSKHNIDLTGGITWYPESMSHKDLSNRNLEGLKINRSIIVGADFTNSNLKDSEMHSLQLFDCKFNKSSLQNTKLFIHANDTEFDDVNLQNANLSNSRLINTTFNRSNLQGVQFKVPVLIGANLISAESLENASLSFDDVAFAVGGHRNVDALRDRTREYYKQLGCDLDCKTSMKAKETEGETNE